jgi:hypothetical protein
MIRYVCKTQEEIKYLLENCIEIPNIILSSKEWYIKTKYDNIDAKFFVSDKEFLFCYKNCNRCTSCGELKDSYEIKVNTLMREEKLKRILE